VQNTATEGKAVTTEKIIHIFLENGQQFGNWSAISLSSKRSKHATWLSSMT